jgi:hypothetical protein|uniref:Uncharacterized protein n=1 Tax=viral metagenome TaxID=1070528 RepID=A0A6C0IVG4_9ZZZZ
MNQLAIDPDSINILPDKKFSDININSLVYHTFVIKSIIDNEDRVQLIVTGIQKCLIPVKYEDSLSNLQFKYRINDDASTDDYIMERKTKTVPVINSTDFNRATVTTNAMKLPLEVNIILNNFPFRLYKASVKIELTSKQVDKEDNSHVTLRPSYVYQDKGTYQNLIRVNNKDRNAIGSDPDYSNLLDAIDKTKSYDILTPIPFIYSVPDEKSKEDESKNIEYAPVVEIGFYLYEPVLESFFKMIAPLFMIMLLMTSTVLIDMDEISYLGMMGGIILAVVFVIKDIRRPSARSKTTTTDIYIYLFLTGLSLCAIGVFHPLLSIVGLGISWLSNIIPVIGYFRFAYITSTIINESHKYNNIIQDPNNKSKSKETIIYDKLVDVPTIDECIGFYKK